MSDADNAVIQPALPQAAGYVVVVVIGLVIAFGSFSELASQSFPD